MPVVECVVEHKVLWYSVDTCVQTNKALMVLLMENTLYAIQLVVQSEISTENNTLKTKMLPFTETDTALHC